MARKLHLSRGSLVFMVVLAVVIIVIGYFAARPRLHPRLGAGDVTRVRVFAGGDRHYEWLVFDGTEIAKLVDMFNAGTDPVLDKSTVGDAPPAGLLFILSNDNGITVSAAPASAARGQVEVARGQYQYLLDAPALADYIGRLGQPATIPASIQTAASEIDAFLTARGQADVAAQGAVCTVNGRENIRTHNDPLPTEALYTGHTLLAVSQEEYSPWQIDPAMQSDVLVVSVEWEAELTDYGRQYLVGQPEAEGHGRLTFLLVRTGAGAPWLVEDWE